MNPALWAGFFLQYLYIVNGQVNHIVHASLLLTLLVGTFFVLQRLPSAIIPSRQEAWCATESPAQIVLTEQAQLGKTLFMSKCASCHQIFKNSTGPSLLRFTEREPWNDRQNVYEWINNPTAFAERNSYAGELIRIYNGVMMQAFPGMTNEEIDAVVEYLNQ